MNGKMVNYAEGELPKGGSRCLLINLSNGLTKVWKSFVFLWIGYKPTV